jgi:uncharacterized DUF497 family protein
MREFVSGFDWDTGSRAKCRKHGVSIDQIEGLFARSVMILPDPGHSSDEQRLRAIGRAEAGRHVFLVFTVRQRGGEKFIRPISARYMHQSEIDSYEEDNPDL